MSDIASAKLAKSREFNNYLCRKPPIKFPTHKAGLKSQMFFMPDIMKNHKF